MTSEYSEQDVRYMRRALQLARQAAAEGEVPVGAVAIKDQVIIGQAGSRQIQDKDPSAHAEVLALRQAAQELGNHRLPGTTLYTTLEPCMMCAGLLVQCRIERLVFGCVAPKTGVICSHGSLLDWSSHNHRVAITHGVLEAECKELMQSFFKSKR